MLMGVMAKCMLSVSTKDDLKVFCYRFSRHRNVFMLTRDVCVCATGLRDVFVVAASEAVWRSAHRRAADDDAQRRRRRRLPGLSGTFRRRNFHAVFVGDNCDMIIAGAVRCVAAVAVGGASVAAARVARNSTRSRGERQRSDDDATKRRSATAILFPK